ncbi:ABC transporter permease [Enterococcus sp. 669A]|uniref:ABC transporter permease n=1 Tax=Candidatus Enterococcus moelleringii TaxID=2815325 RepID=A0ABS3L6N9_9ENTE|nr:ABC transporter permease [Enterococcus sp. 669A]MBO1305291.1 ABC transporter permease [Enterococcus sp. 669A]
MVNTIRADFYRLFHSKGFYVTQIILIAVVVLSVLTEGLVTVGSFSETLHSLQEQANQAQWSGANTVVAMSTMASFLIYFSLPIFIMTIGFDLSRKTLKNLVTSGVSRGKFFFSKYVVFLFMVLMQFVFYYGTLFITASLKSGVGTFGPDYFENLFRALIMQFISVQGIFAFGLLVLFLTFSNISAVLTVVLLPIFISLMSAIYSKVEVFRYLSFQGNIDAAWINVPDNYWLKVAVTCLVVIILCSTVSLASFRKRDI